MMAHTLFQVVNEGATFSIESCDSNLAFKDIRPLGFFVPMQLSDYPFLETHVHTGKFFAGW